MEKLKCPNCDSWMDENDEGDITTDVCSECGGVFLDRGELNTLATGMKGDIEFCSIDHEVDEDKFPPRTCPRCADRKMKKVDLLLLTDIVFDYCPGCGGFFLDKGEVDQMNRELKSLTPGKEAEEYRAEHGGHLVRVDNTTDVVQLGYAGISRFANACYIRISVFFSTDLPPGLRVFHDTWPMRLAKGLGLFWGQDIETGDDRFDSVFRIQGKDEDTVARHFDRDAREALLSFVKSGSTIFGRTGNLEITSSRLSYVEGPYNPKKVEGIVEKCKPLIDELVTVADKIERIPQ